MIYKMKVLLISGLFSLLFTSCSEKFEYVDSLKFNNSIANRTDIETAEELIGLYYGFPENEGTQNISIETKKLELGKIQVTLVHDEMKDDSIKALKIVMIVKQIDQSWTVIEIKKNWKCWEGRGHTNWGAEYCN